MAKVVGDGKVTIPLRIRDLMNIEDGDYARITITETIKKTRDRKTVKKKN